MLNKTTTKTDNLQIGSNPDAFGVRYQQEKGYKMKNGDYSLVVAPDWYKGKRYRGRYCYEHHLVWEKETGCPVPDDCVIHHKDGNKYNNNISNLQLMDGKEHVSLHSKKGRTFLMLKCPNCGKIFDREKRACGYGKRLTFCSRHCVGKFFGNTSVRDKNTLEEAKKENFIKEFVLG
ncbi:MAG: HNH endonuclease [Alphaproteobacteria bacterium]|nr:HNH endonuclease [Alphaproteobacteria bacterium]